MPERSQGPRLWLRSARRSSDGRITHTRTCLIRNDGYPESTRCGLDDAEGGEQALSNHIVCKQLTQAATEKRDAASVAVADICRWRSECNDGLVAGAVGTCWRCRRAKLICTCPPEHPLSFRARWGLRSYAFRLTHGTRWLIAKIAAGCYRIRYAALEMGNA
jgi:hypothetical protein